MKIKIQIKNPETRSVWMSAQQAKTEVESWPAWKRGSESPQAETPRNSSAPPVQKNGT